MSLLVLPTPLPSSSIALGQLITSPLSTTAPSLKPSSPPASQSATQSKFTDTITHDTSGRFISRLDDKTHSLHESLVLVSASEMTHATIDRPLSLFKKLREEDTTRSFLHEMARQNNPVYFVTGIQTLRNPEFKPATVQDGHVTEKTSKPLPVRRRDSFSPLPSPSTSESQTETDVVLAVRLLKLKVRVGAVDEPHCIADLDYAWDYQLLDEGEQLSIGLGRVLGEAELRGLAGMDERVERSYNETEVDDDDAGLGGF